MQEGKFSFSRKSELIGSEPRRMAKSEINNLFCSSFYKVWISKIFSFLKLNVKLPIPILSGALLF